MGARESQDACGECGGQTPVGRPCGWCARIAEHTAGMAPYAARAMRVAVRQALTAGQPATATRMLLGEVPVPLGRPLRNAAGPG